MNNTVTFSQLITRLAKVAGTDTNTSRLYLRSFFALIEETLAKGEDVTIDGIGTFRRHSTDDAFAPDSGISFIPDKTLADEINAPFAVFEPVELADGVDFSGLDTPAPVPAEETLPDPEPTHIPVSEATHEAAPEPEAAATPEPVRVQEPVAIVEEEEIQKEETREEDIRQEEVSVTPTPRPAPQPRRPQWPEEAEKEPEETASEPEQAEDEAHDEYYEEEESERPKTLRWVIYGALGVIAVAAVAYFAAVVVQPIPTFGDDEEEAAAADSVATVVEEIEVEEASAAPAPGQTEPQSEETRPTETAAQPKTEAPSAPAADAKKQEVYDTIKPGYFMAQMARKHYGKAPFWVYIYEANTDVIRNPNRLSNGTRLRIPDKSTFPGATDAEKLKLAIEKQTQLNKKFD